MGLHSVFVTGCNRGIGLEMIRQMASGRAAFGLPNHIFACCREPGKASELKTVADEAANGSKVHILKLDVTDNIQIDDAAKFVDEIVHDDGLNLLINSAGIAQSEKSHFPSVERDNFLHHMDVNVAAPLMITQAFLPLLRRAANRSTDTKLSVHRAAVINVSSGAGSIGSSHPCNARLGVGYRVSKTAFNMVTKCMAMDSKEPILFVSIDPGWVQTDMGGPKATTTAQESVSQMFTVFMSFNEEHNGGFFRRNGTAIPF